MRDKIFSQYVLPKMFLTSNHPYFLYALTPLQPEPFCISYSISEAFRLISIALRLFTETSLKTKYLQIGGAIGKELNCQCRLDIRHTGSMPVWKIAWGREWQSTPVFLAGESHGQRSLVDYSSQDSIESDTTQATQHIYS